MTPRTSRWRASLRLASWRPAPRWPALRLAVLAAARDRRYGVTVTLTIFAVTGFMLTSLSFVAALRYQDHRQAARSGALAQQPAAETAPVGTLLVLPRADTWQDEQFPVVWLEPADADAPLPPGVPALPEPGGVLASPRLLAMIAGYPELAERYPGSRAPIAVSGLRAPDELILYARPAPGRSLAGEPGVLSVKSFGHRPGQPGVITLGFKDDWPVSQIVLVLLLLVGVPSLLLLAVALGTAAPGRDYRIQVVQWLGVSRRGSAAVCAVQAAAVSAPGIVAAVVGHHLLAPSLATVPVVGVAIVPGDAVLGWLPVLLAAAGVLATVLATALVTARWRATHDRPRPDPLIGRVHRWRWWPVIAGLLMVGAGAVVSGRTGGQVVLAGVLVAATALPFALPLAMTAAGARLGRAAWAPTHLAGRLLQRSPTASARPVRALAAIMILAPSVGGFLQLVRHSEAPPERPGTAILISYVNPAIEDLGRLRAATSAALVAGVDSVDGRTTLLGVDCPTLTIHFGGSCRDTGAGRHEVASPRLSRLIGQSTPLLVDERPPATPPTRIVVADPSDQIEQATGWRAAVSTWPGLFVLDLGRPPALGESPLTGPLLAGLAFAIFVLMAAAATGTLDAYGWAANHTRLLGLLGVAKPQRLLIQTLHLVTALAVATFGGLLVGVAGSAAIVQTGGGTQPWSMYAILAAACLTLLAGVAISGLVSGPTDPARVSPVQPGPPA